MNRFNFVKVTKVNPGGKARRQPEARTDTVRLTKHNLIIGKELIKAYKGHKVTVEKDVEAKALRIVAVPKSGRDTFCLSPYESGSSLFTGRPVALVDMPNGNYEQDLKDPSVFVLV